MWTRYVGCYVLGLVTLPGFFAGYEIHGYFKDWWKNRQHRKTLNTVKETYDDDSTYDYIVDYDDGSDENL